ncbi:hypothetical protein WHR41_00905 [Cladosporium halotolerans]|uniref:PRELI/MSF1 domain-containing protein n=1 Tax=Cladosporium halotolerans TaxID=1052096 RepID=A0AB34L4P8_9PEZI
MVKFYSNDTVYDYGFSTVSLAYFLRYPNPYARHVASTDTIERSYDPETQRLTTVRLHLKRSRLPPAVVKLLPRSYLGNAGEDGRTQSFILERSVVDVKNGVMQSESRNLDWNNVLSVIEKHRYERPKALAEGAGWNEETTNVNISVTLKSRIGEQIRKQRARWGEQATATSVSGGEEEAPRRGLFSSWGQGAIRTAIETISLQRTEKSQPKAQKGMKVVLERLRHGGLVEVLEGMRADREVEI